LPKIVVLDFIPYSFFNISQNRRNAYKFWSSATREGGKMGGGGDFVIDEDGIKVSKWVFEK
jgi:hypothetical protein